MPQQSGSAASSLPFTCKTPAGMAKKISGWPQNHSTFSVCWCWVVQNPALSTYKALVRASQPRDGSPGDATQHAQQMVGLGFAFMGWQLRMGLARRSKEEFWLSCTTVLSAGLGKLHMDYWEPGHWSR